MNSKGTTLIELIVVIVLLGIIGGFTFQLMVDSVEIYIAGSNQAELLAEAKLAMERMVREIRDANTILVPVSGSSGDSITFVNSHYTGEGTPGVATFQKSGTTLERNWMGNLRPVADHVSYFNVTNNSDEIKLEITLSRSGGENVTLHTKVYPGNLPYGPSNDFGGSVFSGYWAEVIQ